MRTQLILPLAMLLASCALEVWAHEPFPLQQLRQSDAGEKAEFDVASIKPNAGRPPQVRPHANFPLDAGDAFPATGDLLSATDWPLSIYIQFAYKLNSYQYNELLKGTPVLRVMWYDIEARAPGTPTKDQMRGMMRSLLADRFKLAVHWETRQLPVFELVLSKPGKLGARLKPHPMGAPCSGGPSQQPSAPSAATQNGEAEHAPCDFYTETGSAGQYHVQIENESMALIAERMFQQSASVERPVVDRTGLQGQFDISFDFVPENNGNYPWPTGFQPIRRARHSWKRCRSRRG